MSRNSKVSLFVVAVAVCFMALSSLACSGDGGDNRPVCTPVPSMANGGCADWQQRTDDGLDDKAKEVASDVKETIDNTTKELREGIDEVGDSIPVDRAAACTSDPQSAACKGQ